jgi:hypothetical protein
VPQRRRQSAAGGGIPNNRCGIFTGGDNASAIGAEGSEQDGVVVPQWRTDGLAGGGVPRPGKAVVGGGAGTTGNEAGSILAELGVGHECRMFEWSKDCLTGDDVAHVDTLAEGDRNAGAVRA